jgi:fatty acid desaturase
MHEGAHYNLASNRTWNDRLANVFVGLLVGMHMKPYRPTHFDHHRHLGTPKDTEIAYFDPLNMRFIVESVTGIRILKTLLNRNKSHRVKGIESSSYDGRIAYRALIVTGLLHVAISGTAFAYGFVALSVAWFFGAFTVYPFLGALRTLLEHRSEHASKKVDYRHHVHGAINRMFGAGPFARTFGNAGFNRHLLHHWDPQVSYTRLRDLERFLIDTPAGRAFIEQHATTYSRTFARLYNR